MAGDRAQPREDVLPRFGPHAVILPPGGGGRVGQSAHGSAAARRANATEGPRRARRPAAPDRAGPRPPEGYRRGAAAVDDPLGSAGHGEDDPRGDRREARERAVRRDLGGRFARGGATADPRGFPKAPAADRPA